MLKTAIAAAALTLACGAASAATMDFAVDWGNSSVTLSDQSSGGVNCVISRCGVTASLVGTGGGFTLSEGETEEFGFIRFEGNGTTGTGLFPNDRNFDISATLAFNPPSVSASDNGSGGAHLAFGSIVAGNLDWSAGEQQFALSDGSLITISFAEGSSWLIDGDTGYTLSAYVTLDDLAPVPLPAAGFLMLGGLGGLAALRRRKKA